MIACWNAGKLCQEALCFTKAVLHDQVAKASAPGVQALFWPLLVEAEVPQDTDAQLSIPTVSSQAA